MDITEVRKLRKEMEHAIADYICTSLSRFHRVTGVAVTDIHIDTMRLTAPGEQPVMVVSGLKVEVRL